jgi:hypothetical protein
MGGDLPQMGGGVTRNGPLLATVKDTVISRAVVLAWWCWHDASGKPSIAPWKFDFLGRSRDLLPLPK